MRSSHSMFGIVVEFHSVACQIYTIIKKLRVLGDDNYNLDSNF